jgi:hypothetical protein
VILVYIPAFDEVIDVISGWFRETLRGCYYADATTVLSSYSEVQRERFIEELRRADVVYIIAHGRPDAFGVRAKGELASTKEDAPLYSGKITCALSCSLGAEMGVEIARAGGTFIGYVQDVLLVLHPLVDSYNRRALLKPFASLNAGADTMTAYREAERVYNEVCEELAVKAERTRSPEERELYEEAARCLRHDQESLVHLGEPRSPPSKAKSLFVLTSYPLAKALSLLALAVAR